LNLDTLGGPDDWFIECERCHIGTHAIFRGRDATVAHWNTRVSPASGEREKALMEALKLCEPVLDAELTCLCESYCPPCEVGDTYDYSALQEPELGWITTTEAALNAVIAALAPQPIPGAEGTPV